MEGEAERTKSVQVKSGQLRAVRLEANPSKYKTGTAKDSGGGEHPAGH